MQPVDDREAPTDEQLTKHRMHVASHRYRPDCPLCYRAWLAELEGAKEWV